MVGFSVGDTAHLQLDRSSPLFAVPFAIQKLAVVKKSSLSLLGFFNISILGLWHFFLI